jgi:glycosyltransferase involved in cell wall biosynthesis
MEWMAGISTPRVSIGMPVWNGADFLPEAIDSLLAQTFDDFELIICDNASADATEAICRERMRDDPRIRYYRNDRNIGLQANTQKVLDLATAPYFMWASHDDLWDPSYLAVMVSELDRDDRFVLAGSNAASIDEHGRLRRQYDNWSLYSPASRYARARRLICEPPQGGHSTLIFGLMRTQVIRHLGLARFRNVRMLNRGMYAWDKRALFRLMFEGDYYVARETLYFHRDVVPKSAHRSSGHRVAEGVDRLRRAVNRTLDLHGYFGALRRIVRGSKLAARDKATLTLLSIAQELKYIVAYYRAHLKA